MRSTLRGSGCMTSGQPEDLEGDSGHPFLAKESKRRIHLNKARGSSADFSPKGVVENNNN